MTLLEHETLIEAAQETSDFHFKIIHENELWKEGDYSSFLDYCKRRWNESNPYRKIKIEEIRSELDSNLPIKDDHVYSLRILDAESRNTVWNDLLTSGVRITSQVVESKAKEASLRANAPTPYSEAVDCGYMTANQAYDIFKYAENKPYLLDLIQKHCLTSNCKLDVNALKAIDILRTNHYDEYQSLYKTGYLQGANNISINELTDALVHGFIKYLSYMNSDPIQVKRIFNPAELFSNSRLVAIVPENLTDYPDTYKVLGHVITNQNLGIHNIRLEVNE